MSWSHCGEDKNGRPIGYAHEATCDHPDCNNKIDRGLSYACGGMHGEDEISCDKYFCPEHLSHWVEDCQGDIHSICERCAKVLLESGDWYFNEEECCIMEVK